LGAEAQGIAFSLPVSRTTTLKKDLPAGDAPEK